jgi:antitoxin ChpS
MYTTSLRKVGGSVMLTVPPAVLEQLKLAPGVRVGLDVQDGELVIKPRPRPRYKLAELLAQCDPDIDVTPEEREWLDAPAVGREVL